MEDLLKERPLFHLSRESGPLVSECTAELELPDYLPKIRRILRLNASYLPLSRYRGESEEEYAGELRFSALYLGENGEVAAAKTSCDCRYSIPLSDPSALLFPLSTVEGETVRPSGPRRLSFRALLRTGVSTLTPCPLPRFEEGSPELLEKPFLYASFSEGESGEGSYEVSARAEGIGEEEARLIESHARFLVEGAEASEEVATLKGRILVKSFLSEGGRLWVTEGETPVSLSCAMPGLSEGDLLLPLPDCRAEETELAGGEVKTRVTLSCRFLSVKNREGSTVSDLYYPGKQGRVLCEPLTPEHALGERSAESVVETEGPLSAGGRSLWVLDCDGSAQLRSLALEEKEVVLSCELKAKLLLSGEPDSEGRMTFFTEEITHAFRLSISTEGWEALPDDARCVRALCRLSLSGISAKTDGEGYRLHATVRAHAILLAREEIASAVSYEEEGTLPEREGITVLYPEGNESLWQIAKEMGVPLSRLMADNHLADATLSPDNPSLLDGTAYLIVE